MQILSSAAHREPNLSSFFKCGLASDFTWRVKGWLIVQRHPGSRPMKRLTLPPRVLSSASTSSHKLSHRPKKQEGRGCNSSGPAVRGRHWYTKPSHRLWNQRASQRLQQCERRGDGQPEVSAIPPVSTYWWVYTAKKKKRKEKKGFCQEGWMASSFQNFPPSTSQQTGTRWLAAKKIKINRKK